MFASRKIGSKTHKQEPPVPSSQSLGTDFPTEILLEIFGYLQSTTNLAFQTVCHHWNQTATELLYRDVAIRNEPAIRKFVRTLETSGLGPVVVSLSLGGMLNEESPRSLKVLVRPLLSASASGRSGPWGWDAVLSTVLAKCVNLRTFESRASFCKSTARIPVLPAKAFSKLKTVKIIEPAYDQVIMRREGFFEQSRAPPSHWLIVALSKGADGLDFASLTHLTLASGKPLTRAAWVHFPALLTLVLHEICIFDMSLAALLMAASATLEDITLCEVDIPRTLKLQIRWPQSLPRVRRLALLDTVFFPGGLSLLLHLCSQTVQVLELKLPVKRAPRSGVRGPWPALPALHTFVVSEGLALAAPVIEAFGALFRTLDMSGDPHTLSLTVPAALDILAALKDTLTSLTLRNFDFEQEAVRTVLPQLRAVQTFAVHTGQGRLTPSFHAFLPLNLQIFQLLGYMNEGRFEALEGMVSVDLVVRYPLLKTVEIQADVEEWDLRRQKILREGFLAYGVALRIHFWGGYV